MLLDLESLPKLATLLMLLLLLLLKLLLRLLAWLLLLLLMWFALWVLVKPAANSPPPTTAPVGHLPAFAPIIAPSSRPCWTEAEERGEEDGKWNLMRSVA